MARKGVILARKWVILARKFRDLGSHHAMIIPLTIDIHLSQNRQSKVYFSLNGPAGMVCFSYGNKNNQSQSHRVFFETVRAL